MLQLPNDITPQKIAEAIATDPIGSADYFHGFIKSIFEGLLGVSFEKESMDSVASAVVGGVFGEIEAFYGTIEAYIYIRSYGF